VSKKLRVGGRRTFNLRGASYSKHDSIGPIYSLYNVERPGGRTTRPAGRQYLF